MADSQTAPAASHSPSPAESLQVGPVLNPSGMRADWFQGPWPSNLHRLEDGRIDFDGAPNPRRNSLLMQVLDMAARDRTGWGLNPVVSFPMSGALDMRSVWEDHKTRLAGERLFVVNVDPGSPEFGRRYPCQAHFWEKEDGFQPGRVLTAGLVPGTILLPETTYACLLLEGVADRAGQPVRRSALLQRILFYGELAGEECRLEPVYAPLRHYCERCSLPKDRILTATVFTTWHPAARLKQIYDHGHRSARPRPARNITLTRLEEDYYIFEGELDMPQFQTGEPPYDVGGDLVFNADGVPVPQRTTEVHFVLTLPRQPMPESGFPLCFWVHGSGGTSTHSVDRGRKKDVWSGYAAGEGPALYFARIGVATVSIAMPMNPERYPGASDYAYANLKNQASLIGNFRQGLLELGMTKEFVLNGLDIEPTLAPEALPDRLPLRFDSTKLFLMGQSMGAMYATLWSVVEPAFPLIVLTGAGGYWSYMAMLMGKVPMDTALGKLGARILHQVVSHPLKALANYLLGINNSDLDVLHPMITLGQMSVEHVDPIGMAPHVALRPLPGCRPKSVYYPAGYMDLFFPPPIISALCQAMGLELAGEVVHEPLRQELEHLGRPTHGYPVRENLLCADGSRVTAVVTQFREDDVLHGHNVAFQLDEAKDQYQRFVQSFLRDGLPTVYEPQPTSNEKK